MLLLLLPCLLAAQPVADLQKTFEKKVTEFTLPNGLHFIVIERHDAPVVSFHTYVNVGSVDDPSGQTGLAHMFEHMAFKGTSTIGTKNWVAEKAALAAVEQVYDRLEAERNRGARADAKKVAAIEAELTAAIEKADSFVEENEYDRVVESNGGVDMNAGTGEDSTNYYYSFPSNRIELWFLMESSRFLEPVFREFLQGARRGARRAPHARRIQPAGQAGGGAAGHRLRRAPLPQHARRLGQRHRTFPRPDAERFYKQYYVPANMTIGIAGDVNPAEARRLAEKYFGRLPRGRCPPGIARRSQCRKARSEWWWPRPRNRSW